METAESGRVDAALDDRGDGRLRPSEVEVPPLSGKLPSRPSKAPSSPPTAESGDKDPPLPDENGEPPLANEDDAPPVLDEDEAPPLPDEDEEPPLPDEDEEPPLPDEEEVSDTQPGPGAQGQAPQPSAWSADGMVAAIWDENAGAYYFWDRRTNKTSWENPQAEPAEPANPYKFQATFNAKTGRFQRDATLGDTSRYTDAGRDETTEMEYYDVKRAQDLHDGRSLRAERRNKKITKKEMAQFKQRRDERRRAWLTKESDDDMAWRKIRNRF